MNIEKFHRSKHRIVQALKIDPRIARADDPAEFLEAVADGIKELQADNKMLRARLCVAITS